MREKRKVNKGSCFSGISLSSLSSWNWNLSYLPSFSNSFPFLGHHMPLFLSLSHLVRECASFSPLFASPCLYALLLSPFACVLEPRTMKGSNGTFHSCTSLKSFFNRMGGMISQCNSANNYRRLDPELEKKMVEAIKQRASSRRNSFKSINSIILRFPQYKEGLRTIKSVFEQYDEDSNGTIDRGELKKCLQKLRPHLTDKDIDDLYHSCDIDGHEGIQFTEFVVLLCLTYLLGKPATTPNNTSMSGLPQLETTFETIVEAFLFLDNNCDGKVNKKDMIRALNDASPWEKSPGYITMKRFKEMDWHKNGRVSFKEFLFTFINWVGIDDDDEREIIVTD